MPAGGIGEGRVQAALEVGQHRLVPEDLDPDRLGRRGLANRRAEPFDGQTLA